MNHLKSAWKKTEPIRGLLFFTCLHFTVSLIYILAFSSRFQTDKRIVPLHLGLVLIALVILTVLMGLAFLFPWFRTWRGAKFLLVMLPATTSTFLVLLYTADFFSNSFWGSNVNYQLTLDYALRVNEIVGELPVSAAWVYVPLLLLVLLIFVLHFALSSSLFRSLEHLFLPGRDSSFFRNRSRAVKSALAFALFLAISSQSAYVMWQKKNTFVDVSQEPFMGFFVNSSSFLKETAHTSYVRMRDRQHRDQYPRNYAFARKNVILIVADSLRADHMQLYGYERPTTPFLLSLQKSGKMKKVDLALSTCADTVCSLMSLMSSKNFKNLSQPNFTLYDLLHDQGYGTYFILSGSHDWYGLREYYGGEMEVYFDGRDSKQYSINDDRVIFEGLQQVPEAGGRPAFFYFHLMSPHYSGVKFDEFAHYLPKGKKVDVAALLGHGYNAAVVKNNYDDKVRQTDAVIQRLFDALKQKGYLHNSLIVILGDHGDGLGEHNHFGHVYYAYQEHLRVPLLLYDGEAASYANLKFATQIDVAPTIVDRLGLPIPACWDGVSLLRPDSRQYSFHLSSSRSRCYAVLYRTEKSSFKYLRFEDSKKEELYDLISDPKEERNLIESANRSLVETLRQKCVEHFDLSDL